MTEVDFWIIRGVCVIGFFWLVYRLEAIEWSYIKHLLAIRFRR